MGLNQFRAQLYWSHCTWSVSHKPKTHRSDFFPGVSQQHPTLNHLLTQWAVETAAPLCCENMSYAHLREPRLLPLTSSAAFPQEEAPLWYLSRRQQRGASHPPCTTAREQTKQGHAAGDAGAADSEPAFPGCPPRTLGSHEPPPAGRAAIPTSH